MDIRQYLHRGYSTLALCLAIGLVLAGGALVLGGYRSGQRKALEAEAQRMALPDTLRVLTLSGATTYFTIQQEQMGYQYELLRLYAEEVGLPYSIRIVPTLDSLHTLLRSGSYNLSITPEPITKAGQSDWRFTGPSLERGMVLVQRAPQGEPDSSYLSNVTELIDKPLYILSDRHYEQRLHNLGAQLGHSLDVRPVEDATTNAEDLIALVATDSIDYAIVDSELARLAHTYYPNIDYKLEVGFSQRLRWATTSDYEGLALSIDKWSEGMPSLESAKGIYKKYFEVYKVPIIEAPTEAPMPSQPRQDYRPSTPSGAISPYDDLFRSAAGPLPWSWHLLASIAEQESGFRPEVVAWSGARGLMGIMPATGRSYGAEVEELLSPAVSIRVSVRCLVDNAAIFRSIPRLEERLAFTLASYNAGAGHVQDAQRLTEKYGGNPNSWADVEQYILLKSERKYYTDPVCKHGYLRGKETYNYVREVRERYHRFRGH